MNAFATTSIAPAATWAGFGRLVRRITIWNMRRITRRELSRLDPHLMRDIGLTPPPVEPGVDLMRKASFQW